MTHYEWSIDNPTTIHEHSKAKHQVYREYVKRYLRERVVRPTFDRYCINIIDGFAGGGIYASGPTRNVYYGSPIILLETLHEMQAELQARQSKPFLLDYNVHFVDVSSEAIATLADVLKARGFGHLISLGYPFNWS